LLLAFSAGILAAFNPCGFALLPAYLGMFLADREGGRAVRRALAVGAAVTMGFVVTFGMAGFAVSALSLRFGEWISALTVVLGVVLVGAGIVLLAGRKVLVRFPRAKLAVSGSPVGMFSYGIIYATVSLSCTLPVFMAAVATSFTGTGSLIQGTGAFLAYALGMGSVLTVLALAMALFRDRAASGMRRITPHIDRISAVFLLTAGAYVIWYGYVEFRSFRGDLVTTGPTAWVADASAAVSNTLSEIPLFVFPLAPALAVVGVWWLNRRGPRTTDLNRDDSDTPEPSNTPQPAENR
jgi:cytochrome c biogenesis protein CcdA